MPSDSYHAVQFVILSSLVLLSLYFFLREFELILSGILLCQTCYFATKMLSEWLQQTKYEMMKGVVSIGYGRCR